MAYLKPDPTILPALAQVSTWATGVTHEVAGGSKKKIKIPDVCINMGVRFMTPFTMLRKERARFVLKRKG